MFLLFCLKKSKKYPKRALANEANMFFLNCVATGKETNQCELPLNKQACKCRINIIYTYTC
jgi:hypothetical protein